MTTAGTTAATAAAQRGTTTVSERAVRRIAERATTEALPGRTAHTTATVRGGRAEVSLGVTLPYPAPLAEGVRDVQQHVLARTRELTGLEVPTAHVDVVALVAPRYSRPPLAPAEGTGESGERRTTARRWSRRRVPVTLLTSLAAVACAALAVDLIRVHIAHGTAAAWRVSAVHWLSGHAPGDPAVVLAGGLTALIGVWMVVLALTPGLRRRSTVRTGADRVDTTVDRSAVESLIRDTVADVNGITTVRVRVRPRRITVRAGLAFGDRERAATAVTTAARDAVTSCRLRKAPRVRVTVTPEQVWQRPAPAPEQPSTTPATKEVDQ
ncbi:DUF6286 domain-containing protein [Streptomyces sp. NPDC101776]|uniref:DUF6286 domain-containing protein n=1 Tax=Streptomyces sp. NPDC101776 TaxID=3366146 RepID=UPI0038079455